MEEENESNLLGYPSIVSYESKKNNKSNGKNYMQIKNRR